VKPSTSPFELDCEDAETDRNHDEGGPWKNQEREAYDEDRHPDDADHDATRPTDSIDQNSIHDVY